MSDTSIEQSPVAGRPELDFHIVGIGASAGGLEALEKLFSEMPVDSGMAFVVVQHLSPDFKSLMDELLARHTSMPIHRVKNGMPVEPNGIYLIPSKKNMVISGRRLLLTEQDTSGGLNLPIDIFFRSLAHDVGNRAVAVVLSGTGSDGSRGLQDVHESGGLVVAQDVQSSAFDGMPRNAIATGLVDVLADPEGIAERLCRYVEDPDNFKDSEAEIDIPILPGTEMTSIFRLFRGRYGIDFTLYRENTIHRRIERRMNLIRSNSLAEYVRILLDDRQELDNLYRDLLVEVTHFFRDPQVFERLRQEVVPQILAEAKVPRDELRVWVPGCATGEEAYTIAMVLDDCLSRLPNLSPVVKVFATDVHRNSLEIASSGVYTSEGISTVPPDFRNKYFTQHSSLFHVSRKLRQMVIFAPHDITKDPPFTKVDLISCRNVLIYLEPSVQRRVLSLFHFGLKVGGTLVLGPSESISDLNTEFETIDQHWRIFKKIRDVRLPDASNVRLAAPLFDVIKTGAGVSSPAGSRSQDFVERTVLEDLLDKYVPPSFLVTSHFELVHSFGDARRLLVQPRGRSTLELLKLVEGDLRMAMSAALHRAMREKEQVVLQGIRIDTGDGSKLVEVVAEPYLKRSQDLYLVSVKEIDSSPPPSDPTAETFRADDQAAQRIIELERELEFNKESLQTTVEELESSNEELQSTNEELVAANEELQSTNEELHSVNEELYTVNAEHQRKIDELSQLTTDMDNLMRSTEIGTIFLDKDLRIRRFTPAITTAFNIMDQDVGRPIDQFAYHLESPGWIEAAKQVIVSGEPSEEELKARGSDRVYLKRMRPYRNSDKTISGIVITFTDVTAIAHAEKERIQKEHLERIARDMQDFVYAVSHDLQAPSRQIIECISRLEEHLREDADEETSRLLRATSQRTHRLQSMFRCLLEYSRINTRGHAFESVNLDRIVSELTEEYREVLDACEAKVTRSNLPTIQADPVQLKTCFRCILDNAIKFQSEVPLEVHVDAITNDEDRWQIRVQDNGIGLEKDQCETIFQIFRKLGIKDAEGEGAGLAICRRILERHKGQIWAESTPLGTAIYLKLPSKQPNG